MKTFVQRGNFITIPAPYDVASGDFVIWGNLKGVAAGDAPEGSAVDIATRGVFRFPKDEADVFELGSVVCFDEEAKQMRPVGQGSIVGLAVTDAPTSSTTVDVKIG